MLPRKHRISTDEFADVMEKGKVVHSPLFLMRILKRETASIEEIHVGAVASQKVAKTAVLRNKTRRRMYAMVDKLLNRLNPGMNIVIFAKEKFLQADEKLARVDLENLFVKAGLLK